MRFRLTNTLARSGALLIGLNARYKVSAGMGFRLTYLPDVK